MGWEGESIEYIISLLNIIYLFRSFSTYPKPHLNIDTPCLIFRFICFTHFPDLSFQHIPENDGLYAYMLIVDTLRKSSRWWICLSIDWFSYQCKLEMESYFSLPAGNPNLSPSFQFSIEERKFSKLIFRVQCR